MNLGPAYRLCGPIGIRVVKEPAPDAIGVQEFLIVIRGIQRGIETAATAAGVGTCTTTSRALPIAILRDMQVAGLALKQ